MSREHSISVTFGDMPLEARPGDILAAALIRSGRLQVGESPVLARPRGIRWADRPSEVKVTVEGREGQFDPGKLALWDGMVIHPSKGCRMPAPVSRLDLSTSLLVIGGGPAGMIAALTAAKSGCDVILLEAGPKLGGAFRWDLNPEIQKWRDRAVFDITKSDVQVLLNTRATGFDGERWSATVDLDGCHENLQVTAPQTIFATGATDRMIAFSGNDLPGVMSQNGFQRAVNEWGVLPGKRIALFANNDAAYDVLATAEKAGIEVVAIVDVRGDVQSPKKGQMFAGSVIESASGSPELQSIQITGQDGEAQVMCDTLVVSGGSSPSIGVLATDNSGPIWNPTISAWLLQPGIYSNVHIAGAAGGSFTPKAALKSGYFRTRRALSALGHPVASMNIPDFPDPKSQTAPFWQVPGSGPSFLDFSSDTTLEDLISSKPASDRDSIAQKALSHPNAR